MENKKEGAGQSTLISGASMGRGVDLAECFAQGDYDLILTAGSRCRCRELVTLDFALRRC